MTNEYIFTLPIGDWSGDGHGSCECYEVTSNKPVEEVREVHFKIKEATGIDIHDIANEYEENSVSADHPVIEFIKNEEMLDAIIENYNPEDDRHCLSTDGMAYLWVSLLMATDKTLRLETKAFARPELLPFYGHDKQKRHIGFVGYGTLY